MQYGHFDNKTKEYVIDRPDVPVSWTNYLGVKDLCTVISHNAGGYTFYKTPQYHRVTRFRPNGVPLDRPGHYVYVRDDETGEFWSLSWQPVGKPFGDGEGQARYETRHGLSYSKFSCDYQGIQGEQTLFIPVNDPVEIWDVVLKNTTNRPRKLSVFSYCEFSYHHIEMDNQNFQMSLYATGADCKDGIIEYDHYYDEKGFQYMAASFEPDSFDCRRDEFLGSYRTETNPIAVEKGVCTNSQGTTGNFCGGLHKRLELKPFEEASFFFLLGEGRRADGAEMRKKYSAPEAVSNARDELSRFWYDRLSKLQIRTPNAEMDTMLNVWTMYQAEINVLFSRFSSFIEVGGRTGLGYRDTAQDAMCIPHAEQEGCKTRLLQLLHGQVSQGYGLHLFEPKWFMETEEKQSFKSPTVVPTPDKNSMIHGLKDVCSDDALWLVTAVVEYVRETGDSGFFDEVIPFADEGSATVYEHIKRALEFTASQLGAHGICKGLRADWNDCLNLGGGESAMTTFLYHWAMVHFVDAARFLGRNDDAELFETRAKELQKVSEEQLWDGKWYLRGFTATGRKIGSDAATEGKVHMESNTWAVISGAASSDRALSCMDAVDEYLYTDYGLMLNAPSFRTPDDELGFVARVYPGIKENGAVFSHPNPWAWVAECMNGRGSRAMKFYNALLPALQNDKIEIRKSEPYSYCQFIMGKEHELHGQANHPWMTGTGGWAYFAATRYMLGIRPEFTGLRIDPCVPADWDAFLVNRVFRGATYRITVTNPKGVEKGVKSVKVNGKIIDGTVIDFQTEGAEVAVEVEMG